jgi:hypothetical protein
MFFHRLRASSSKIRGFSSRNFSQIEIILCVLKKRVSTNIISDFRDIEPTKKRACKPMRLYTPSTFGQYLVSYQDI